MKGICLIWSRGRHFSPSMPGDRYLKLGSKSDHRAEISGNIVRYDALAPRPEVLRSFSSLYANNVFWVLLLAQALVSFQTIEKWQFSVLFKIVSFLVYLLLLLFLRFFFLALKNDSRTALELFYAKNGSKKHQIIEKWQDFEKWLFCKGWTNWSSPLKSATFDHFASL